MNQIGLLLVAIAIAVTASEVAYATNRGVLHERRAESSAAPLRADTGADFSARTRGMGLG